MARYHFNLSPIGLSLRHHHFAAKYCGERTNDVYKAANIEQLRRLRNCESEREGSGKGCKIKRDPCTLQGHLITNSQVQASDHVANNL